MSMRSQATSYVVADAHQPATFAERGVHVPFTTPMLSGARARAAKRGGLELIVPNPSGGRGAYVLPWTGVRDLCSPTVHDMRLHGLIAVLPRVTPDAVRLAARAAAAEGLAGRQAKAATLTALDRDRSARQEIDRHLLVLLVRQKERPEAGLVAPEAETPEMLQRRARRVIVEAAPQLGLAPGQIVSILEELAGLLLDAGIGPLSQTARLPKLLAAIAALRDETHRRAADPADEAHQLLELIRATCDFSIACATPLLRDVRLSAGDIVSLIHAWSTDPGRIAALCARPGWVLDGWERVCLLWQQAETAAEQRAALGEIAILLPLIPREAESWLGRFPEPDQKVSLRSIVEGAQQGHPRSSLPDLIARNERLVAMAG